MKGIDVSSYQGNIDWAQVKASGIDFAYIKATEGTALLDSNFLVNFAKATLAGVKVGAYHYGHPNEDPIANANVFINAVKRSGYGDLPLVLDLEITGGLTTGFDVWAEKFLEQVKSATNRPVMLYSGEWFTQNYLVSLTSKYPLWIAKYGTIPPNLKWTVWQQSETGQVPGIQGNVDIDEGADSLLATQVTYPSYDVVVKDHVFSAIAVNTDTYILYTALDYLGIPYTFDGNTGTFTIAGKQARCVLFNGTHYVMWRDMLGVQAKKVEWLFTR